MSTLRREGRVDSGGKVRIPVALVLKALASRAFGWKAILLVLSFITALTYFTFREAPTPLSRSRQISQPRIEKRPSVSSDARKPRSLGREHMPMRTKKRSSVPSVEALERRSLLTGSPPPVFVPIHQFYVATYGTPNGDGSLTNPWDLQTALNQPASVHPGDEIWVRGGTYTHTGNFTSNLTGTANSPIVVREYPGELATLDGVNSPLTPTLSITGPYSWFWGLDVTDSYTLRIDPVSFSQSAIRSDSVYMKSVGLKLINMTIHDGCNGVGSWSTDLTPSNSEIYGCVIYNNGYQDPNGGVGHGIYAQNQTGTVTIEDSIILNQFGYGMQIYGSASAYTNNFVLLNNDIVNPGSLNTGGSGVQSILLGDNGNISQDPVLTGNTIYINHDPTSAGQATIELGYWGAGVSDATLTGNYFYSNNGGYTLNNNSGQGITFLDSTGNSFSGNTGGEHINITYDLSAGNTLIDGKPTANSVFVRPNDFEPGRANIAVFNWQDLPSVSVDVSSAGLAVGQNFQVIDAQNPLGGPVLTGVYTGAPIALPMTLTAVAQPVGNAPKPAQHTGIEYGSFVILPGTINQTGTSTSLHSSVSPAAYGQPVTFQATVAPGAPGAGVPTGTVTFSAGTTVLGTAPVVGSGTATFTTTSPLPVGTNAITSTYGGDTNFQASSGSLTGGEVVTQASTVTSVSVVSPAGTPVYGQPVTFQATVTPVSPGAGVPTGTVTFSAGTTVLGSALVDGSGTATFTTTSPLPVGTNAITSTYSGDTDFLASNGSLAGGEVVSPAGTATTLTSTIRSLGHNTSVTFTATVIDPVTGLVPTGQVQFWDGTTLLATVTLDGQGVASWTTKKLQRGSHTIVAVFLGTTNFDGSTSNTSPLNVA
jgi:Bacterial Ig-like domain (group 3)